MSQLEKLKSAMSLQDVAQILGFKPKSVSYILYKKSNAEKYKQFELVKRSGGMRVINAPYSDLKNLQKRLAELLDACINEINIKRNIKTVLAHGFRPNCSIITNASSHRKKRYVFNLDLENFFDTINFGRVRGFFISNRNFELHPAVATVLAQIACHNNSLPQGSPCSPVISNLIGHLIDIRLAALAANEGCIYSRYADDLTFSTNKKIFPSKLAKLVSGELHSWEVGGSLEKLVNKTGFTINHSKTRMQYKDSRQDVTGLVVNLKTNTRAEYRKLARARVHSLLKTGSYQITKVSKDELGTTIIQSTVGNLNQLHGMLSFIDSVNVHNRNKSLVVSELKKSTQPKADLNSGENVYKQFLLYKYFFAPSIPLILCEGKTDNIYIRSAIKMLFAGYPDLAEKNPKDEISFKVNFFHRSETTGRILNLTGGTGEFTDFIKDYLTFCRKIAAPGKMYPIILLIDNDSGANGIYNYISNLKKTKIERSDPYIYVGENLYIVPTPRKADGGESMIEDFFEEAVLKTELNGKKFNPSDSKFDHKTQYGKAYFAEHVIKKNESKINFSGFKPILNRINQVLIEHSKKIK